MSTALPNLLTDRGPCPMCGGSAFVLVHDFDQIPIRRCMNAACGLLHSGRSMTPEGKLKYYSEGFGSEFHRAGQVINSAVVALAMQRLLDLRGVKTFLDVGTGYGYLVRELKSRGVAATGVEVSTQEVAYAKEHLGLTIISGLLDDAGLRPESFDAAGSFEVIEHLLDPVPFVASIARHVKPGGWVVIGTDNFASPIVDAFGARFPKWIPHTHVCHFEPATLKRCIERVPGLRVEGVLSYTQWENALRAPMARVRGWSASKAQDVWRLESHMEREMRRGYPMPGLRKAIALSWFRLSAGTNDRGSMMFMLARKD